MLRLDSSQSIPTTQGAPRLARAAERHEAPTALMTEALHPEQFETLLGRLPAGKTFGEIPK